MTKQTAETFWAKVAITDDENDCWVWTGALTSQGYGSVRWGGTTYLSHRIAAWLSGLIPHPKRDPNDLSSVVMHGCDNKLCCNPNHLFPSTQSENLSEQHRKGNRRCVAGENSHRATLTNEQAKEIYDKYHAGGYTQKALAEEYNTTLNVVNNVTSRRRYKVIHEQ